MAASDEHWLGEGLIGGTKSELRDGENVAVAASAVSLSSYETRGRNQPLECQRAEIHLCPGFKSTFLR